VRSWNHAFLRRCGQQSSTSSRLGITNNSGRRLTTFAYPSGTNKGNFTNSIVVSSRDLLLQSREDQMSSRSAEHSAPNTTPDLVSDPTSVSESGGQNRSNSLDSSQCGRAGMRHAITHPEGSILLYSRAFRLVNSSATTVAFISRPCLKLPVLTGMPPCFSFCRGSNASMSLVRLIKCWKWEEVWGQSALVSLQHAKRGSNR
jgi:hypothetical protein